MLKKIVILLTLILWPLNLYLANTQSDFISYSIPVLLLIISYFLYRKYPKYYLLPIVLIGVSEKKLILLPIIFCLLEIMTKFTKQTLLFLILSISLFVIFIPAYKGQLVFNKDYEGEQLILRNIHLYPNIPIARIFQNKSHIYLNKITNNFFTIIDPNNYFFASHPAQTTTANQNLYKYPFVALIFLLYGIYWIKESNNKIFILFSFTSSLVSLIILNNFDRSDFILWLPISLIIIHGIETISQKHKKLWALLSWTLVFFTIPEALRSFIERN